MSDDETLAGPRRAADQIDAAIAATEPERPAVDMRKMQQIQIVLEATGGRVVMMLVPADLRDDELLELLANLVQPVMGLRSALEGRPENAPRGPQLVAAGALAGPDGRPLDLRARDLPRRPD